MDQKLAFRDWIACWIILIFVGLSALPPLNQDPIWIYYLYNALIDGVAILVLTFFTGIIRAPRYLAYSYGIYAFTHFLGWLANGLGIVFLYKMYPIMLIAILAVQLLIMVQGYGDIRRIRRRYISPDHIPAIIISNSYDTKMHKKRNDER